MQIEGLFNFPGRQPLASDPQHVITSSTEVKISRFIHRIAVSGNKPFTHHIAPGFLPLVPVGRGDGAAADHKVPDLARTDRFIIFIQQPGPVARYNLSGTAGSNLAEPVGEKYVANLSGTGSVQNFNPEFFLKVTVDFRR